MYFLRVVVILLRLILTEQHSIPVVIRGIQKKSSLPVTSQHVEIVECPGPHLTGSRNSYQVSSGVTWRLVTYLYTETLESEGLNI